MMDVLKIVRSLLYGDLSNPVFFKKIYPKQAKDAQNIV
jgi:hypothetical protein